MPAVLWPVWTPNWASYLSLSLFNTCGTVINYVWTTKEDDWIEFGATETNCTSSVFYTSTHESTTVESYCKKIKTADADEDLKKFRSLELIVLSLFVTNILYLWYVFFSNVDITSLLRIKFNSFRLLSLLLECTGYFQRAASLPA